MPRLATEHRSCAWALRLQVGRLLSIVHACSITPCTTTWNTRLARWPARPGGWAACAWHGRHGWWVWVCRVAGRLPPAARLAALFLVFCAPLGCCAAGCMLWWWSMCGIMSHPVFLPLGCWCAVWRVCTIASAAALTSDLLEGPVKPSWATRGVGQGALLLGAGSQCLKNAEVDGCNSKRLQAQLQGLTTHSESEQHGKPFVHKHKLPAGVSAQAHAKIVLPPLRMCSVQSSHTAHNLATSIKQPITRQRQAIPAG